MRIVVVVLMEVVASHYSKIVVKGGCDSPHRDDEYREQIPSHDCGIIVFHTEIPLFRNPTQELPPRLLLVVDSICRLCICVCVVIIFG